MKKIAIACMLAMQLAGVASAEAAKSPAASASQSGIVVREATNMAVLLSPKGDQLVLSLYNVLHSVPVTGGKAQAVTDLVFDGYHPSWAPDGSNLAVQSYADGRFHIWIVSGDGRFKRQVTTGVSEDTYPAWSPDGKQIAFSSNRSSGTQIWLLTVGSGELKQLTNGPGNKTEPVWSRDGKEIAYIQGGGGGGFGGPASGKVQATNLSTNLATNESRTLIADVKGGLTGLAWSPDGKTMSYVKDAKLTLNDLASGTETQLPQHDDVFPFPAQWTNDNHLIYGANGKIIKTNLANQQSSEIPFEITLALEKHAYKRKQYDLTSTKPQAVKGIVGPALSPDGKQIVFKALNDIWLLTVGNPKPEKLTNDGYYEVDPAWSRDGKSIVYTSDKGGTPDIYQLDLASKEEKRLTSLPGSEFGAALSADGQLAFQDEDTSIHVRNLNDSNAPAGKKVATGSGLFGSIGRPSWSGDGKALAYANFQRGANLISIVDLQSGKSSVVEPAPQNGLTARGDEGPIWSPDGKWLAFTMEANLWVLPVNEKGEAAGPAIKLTEEVADAMSWKGDSNELLYLSNGKLKLVGLNGGKSRAVPLSLTWKNDVAEGATLIHVGALWDGKNPQLQKNVDILVKGARIVSIKPHSDASKDQKGVTFVDASGYTVTPGLIDAHYHQQIKSKPWGDRQGRLFLSFGITTTRSPGDQAYRSIEDREALAAGTRLGPRHFTAGEILDGYSASWDFSRAVMTDKQLDLELQRAQALDYDLIKTYSNFRHDWQQKAIKWSHEKMGVPVASHFLYPSAGMGADNVEHIQSGPVRHGINFSSRGRMYQDVIDIFAQSGIAASTTIFAAAYQYGEHPEILNDPRIKAFYMTPDQKALEGRVSCASGKGGCGPLFTPSKAGTENLTNVAKRILTAGGKVINGTDAPLDESALSLHNNIRGMAAFSLSPFEVLQLTTSKAAESIGIGKDVGTVEPGKLADLIIVSGDPSKDVADLAKVQSVMKGGRYYTMNDILGPFKK